MKRYILALGFMLTYLCTASQVLNCKPALDYGNNAEHGHYAFINGINMYYETYGDPGKQPLLLIHGNGGSVKAGSCQIDYFKEDYFVVAADSRYQGKSENGAEELTYELMASDFFQLLKHLGLGSVNIIGQSDGAIIGLLLAMEYPSAVHKLVAAAPNLRPDSTALYPWNIEKMEHDLREVKTKLTQGDSSKENIRKKALIEKMLKYPHIEPEELRKITAPVLLVFGDSDYMPFGHIVEIYQHIPKSNLFIFPGAGHRSYRLEPDLFNTFAKRFFDNPFRKPFARDGY